MKNKLIFLLLCRLALASCFSFAQQGKIDSLTSRLHSHVQTHGSASQCDTNCINTLNALSWELLNQGDYEKAMQYANDALALANSLPNGEGRGRAATAYSNIGIIHYNKGGYDKALEFYFKSLKITEEIGDKKGMAHSYNNIGIIHYNKGDYDKALEFHFKSLKIREETGDKKGMAASYNNIGTIHYNKGGYDKALEFYFKSLKIREETGDKKGMAASYNNIGIIHENKGDYDKALEFYFKSLKIREETGDKKGMAASYNNIGIIHYSKGSLSRQQCNCADDGGNYDKALEFYFKSLKIREETGDKNGMAASYGNIGMLYTSQKKYSEAREYLNKGLTLSKAIGTKEPTMNAYAGLSQLDSTLGNFKGAYEYHKLYSQVKDSIFNEESNKQMTEMQTKYETEKKEKEIELQKTQIEKKDVENKKQKIITWSVVCGLLLVILFAALIFRQLNITKKQKQIIEIKSKETEEKKLIIEEKQKEITDSITYALRIQKAILPHRSAIWKELPKSFVLYKPKDIVAGDFYWFYSPSPSGGGREGVERAVLIAAADCTGHGVPGAFTSMICSEKLNDAVKQNDIPGEILSIVNKGIKTTLKQAENTESTKDGMDIALCSVDIENGIVKYAGANRPLYLIRTTPLPNGEGSGVVLEEIKATKNAIGGFTEDDQVFETHTIQLQPGDTFYLSSDGYADQVGGDKGKKLMSKNFKQMLINIQDRSMKEQKEYLDDFMENWRAGGHQLDDILVIGVRI